MQNFTAYQKTIISICLIVQVSCLYSASLDKPLGKSLDESSKDALFTNLTNNDAEGFEKSFSALTESKKTIALRAKNESGQTLLAVAINKEIVPAVDLLIASAADVNEQTPSLGWTPLMYAVVKGNAEITIKLLDTKQINFDLKSNVLKKTAREMAVERRANATDKEKLERYNIIIDAINNAMAKE